MQVRSADAAEIDHLARLWYDGWHETHAPLQPPELTRLRTLESFRERLQIALPNIRVAGPLGAPVGFCVLKGEELYQLFVSPKTRGSDVAAALIADAEARLAECGAETAWLACAIGNDRAARFYEKSGWRLAGTVVNPAETSSGRSCWKCGATRNGSHARREHQSSLSASVGCSDPAGAPAPPPRSSQRSRCSRRRRPFENPIGSLLGTSVSGTELS